MNNLTLFRQNHPFRVHLPSVDDKRVDVHAGAVVRAVDGDAISRRAYCHLGKHGALHVEDADICASCILRNGIADDTAPAERVGAVLVQAAFLKPRAHTRRGKPRGRLFGHRKSV